MNNHTYNRIKLIRKETLLQQIQVESDDYGASWLTHLTSPTAVSSYFSVNLSMLMDLSHSELVTAMVATRSSNIYSCKNTFSVKKVRLSKVESYLEVNA